MISATVIGIDFGYNYSRAATSGYFNIQQFTHLDKLGVPSNLLYENNNFLIERNNKALNDNIKVIKQIRKLINKKVPIIDNFQIKDNDKISCRTITIDKTDYTVEIIIQKFIQLLIKHFSIRTNSIILSVITIPAYFDDEQRQIIKSSVKCITKKKIDVLLLEEPIAALYALSLSSKKIDDNYLVLTFYEDLLDLSIISIDNNMEPFVKQPALFDDTFRWKNRFIRLKDFCENKYLFDQNEIENQLYNNEKTMNLNNNTKIKKIDLYKDLFDNCKKLLQEVNLDKKNLDKIIVIGNSEFNDKDILEYYFNCEVIFSKIENTFVNGAVKFAQNSYKKINEEKDNITLNTFRRNLGNYNYNNFYDRIRTNDTQRMRYEIHSPFEDIKSIEEKKNNSKLDKILEQLTENNIKNEKSIKLINEHNSKLDKILEQLSENNIKNEKSIEEIKDRNSKLDSILEILTKNNLKNEKSIEDINQQNSKLYEILEKLTQNNLKNEKSIEEINEHNSKLDKILEQLTENNKKNEKSIKVINEHNIKMEGKFDKILNNVQETNQKLSEKYKNMEEQFMNTAESFNNKFKEIDRRIDLKKIDFEKVINSYSDKSNKTIDEKLNTFRKDFNEQLNNLRKEINEKTNKGYITNKKETIIAKNVENTKRNDSKPNSKIETGQKIKIKK